MLMIGFAGEDIFRVVFPSIVGMPVVPSSTEASALVVDLGGGVRIAGFAGVATFRAGSPNVGRPVGSRYGPERQLCLETVAALVVNKGSGMFTAGLRVMMHLTLSSRIFRQAQPRPSLCNDREMVSMSPEAYGFFFYTVST